MLALAQQSSQSGQGFLNAFMTSRQNRLSRKFSKEMYTTAHQDNLDFWRMQNEYNHPQAQFDRMTGSGFNPKTLFGGGNAGNAGPITSPTQQPIQNQVPLFGDAIGGVGSTLMQMYDMELKQSQVDAQRAKIAVDHETVMNMRFDRGYKETTMPYNIEALKLNNRGSAIDQMTKLNKEQRDALMFGVNYQQGLINLVKTFYDSRNSRKQNEYLDAQISKLKADASLQRLRIQKGQVWAPAYRLAGAFANDIEVELQNLLKKGPPKKASKRQDPTTQFKSPYNMGNNTDPFGINSSDRRGRYSEY